MTYKDFIVIFHAKNDIKMKKMNQNVHEIDLITAQKNKINMFKKDVRYLKSNDVGRAYSSSSILQRVAAE
jgi:alpha-glucuronidase